MRPALGFDSQSRPKLFSDFRLTRARISKWSAQFGGLHTCHNDRVSISSAYRELPTG